MDQLTEKLTIISGTIAQNKVIQIISHAFPYDDSAAHCGSKKVR